VTEAPDHNGIILKASQVESQVTPNVSLIVENFKKGPFYVKRLGRK